jgi:hypothetical protein
MPNKRVSDKDIVVSAAAPARHKPATNKRTNRTAPAAPGASPAPSTAAEPVATQSATQPAPNTASPDQIAALAYSYWVARGYQGGSQEEDWLRAEQELQAVTASAATATA